jgi:hypothetical protein
MTSTQAQPGNGVQVARAELIAHSAICCWMNRGHLPLLAGSAL